MQLLLNRYKYSNDDLVGKGGFSSVYKGYDIKTNKYIAIKIDNKIKYNKKEAKIYEKINNFKYMAKYIDYFELNKKDFLGTLNETLDSNTISIQKNAYELMKEFNEFEKIKIQVLKIINELA